ncbi:phosphatidylinositol glycan anchor biosynthesis class Q [Haematobia irritans]|uniref:phosphatidylinositol glycan anchor biosynthesis class Q n=1 Tax=Haematobia irritans TaxID=7368 RepID=UPI003F5090CF
MTSLPHTMQKKLAIDKQRQRIKMIKIFLPENIFSLKENCDIYGETIIGERSISYYIVCAIDKIQSKISSEDAELEEKRLKEEELTKHFRHLGHILNAQVPALNSDQDVSLVFGYDSHTPNIYLHKLSIKTQKSGKINVFLYDERRVLKLQDLSEAMREVTSTTTNSKDTTLGDQEDTDDKFPNNDMHFLFQLLQAKEKIKSTTMESVTGDFFLNDIKRCVFRVFGFIFNFMMWTLTLFLYQPPFKYIFQHTVLCEHYKEWIKFRNCRKRRFNIAFDTFLGLCVMVILVFYIDSPGDYLIKASHFVVTKFRILLLSLEGSPIGLKLNVQLNKFLLKCFGYHVELWDTFLNEIEPCIRQLFIPITFLGSMGLSYQLALLTDIISVIGLHAHCFSIYASVLYKVEIKGLQVLWKMFLGKRRNVLKNRVESHTYKNRQLYLGTVFFACLLFLFPTIVTYYVVFTTLRLCINFVSFILKTIRRQILEFPMEMLLNWTIGCFYDTESLQLDHIEHTPSPIMEKSKIEMCVFKISVNSSSLGRVLSCHSGVLQELVANENNSIKTICQKILGGTF